MNPYLESDVCKLATQFKFKEELRGKSILVTGATGLIGSVITRFLDYLNRTEHLNIKIFALVRDTAKACTILGATAATYIEADLAEGIQISIPESEKIDYIIHCASPTASVYLSNNPVETMDTIYSGTNSILKTACQCGVESMVFLSSIESYGIRTDDGPVTEDYQGYVDPLSPRSSYPVAKRAAETLCAAYSKEYGTPVKIVRLTQVFGAGVSPGDNRVFAQFARSVKGNRDIILHTTGESSKPYCYTTDAVDAIFHILLMGKNGEAYNVANKDTYISIRGLAEYMTTEFNPAINVTTDIGAEHGYAPATLLRIDTTKTEALGWKPEYGLKVMLGRLIESL